MYIVVIDERVSCHGNDVDAMAFSSREKAESWIEAQIDSYVKELRLDRESTVDGWEVKLDGERRTIRYSIVERGLNLCEPLQYGDAVLSDALEKLLEQKRRLFNRVFGPLNFNLQPAQEFLQRHREQMP